MWEQEGKQIEEQGWVEQPGACTCFFLLTEEMDILTRLLLETYKCGLGDMQFFAHAMVQFPTCGQGDAILPSVLQKAPPPQAGYHNRSDV